MMKGEVKAINARQGMIAVLTENGDYSIMELLGAEVELGQTLKWKGHHPLGSETILNVANGTNLDVYFQNHCVPENQLRQQLLC